MKHQWTIDIALPLDRDQAQRAFASGQFRPSLTKVPNGRRIYCARCWVQLDHKNLDGECVSRREEE